MPLNRRSFLGLSTILLSSPLPVFSSENKQAKRILVYGDSNSFGWAWSPEKDIYRLPIDQIWPQVMAQKLGPNYEVEVNALGGRTVKRDQKDGNGTGKSLPVSCQRDGFTSCGSFRKPSSGYSHCHARNQ